MWVVLMCEACPCGAGLPSPRGRAWGQKEEEQRSASLTLLSIDSEL